MFSSAVLCLALTIYHESRNQPLEGQVAVANVVLNREADWRFPNTICDVVTQGGESLYGCQFTFYCDGKSDQMKETIARDNAISLAIVMITGIVPDNTYGALFYHANYVRPYWAEEMSHQTTIGEHLFYLP